MTPQTRYANSGGVSIAYQVLGEGALDLVVVPGWVSNLDAFWEEPSVEAFFLRLASFSRLILYDKRGTGLSDRVADLPSLEVRMDDVRAVLDAVGSQRAALLGYSEGGAMCALFAATYPQRTSALITVGSYSRMMAAPGYEFGRTQEQKDAFLDIPGATFIELQGIDHVPWLSDSENITGHIEEFLTGMHHHDVDDRILATVLFTDIAGATETAARLGDKRWRELLAQHHVAVRHELQRFRGREVDTAGDGFFATFDGLARAVRCACAVSDAMRPLGIELRAGVHTGECEVMGDKVGGIAVHIGARITACAEAGEVLVSRTVKDLVSGSGLAFNERGEESLKGVPGRWMLFAEQR